MRKKYILNIDKEDLPKLIKGEAFSLTGGNEFCVEVNGTPTNGDVIKAMFPNAEIKEIRNAFDKDKLLGYRTWLGGRSQDYLLDWWNSPYKAESEEEE